ncbi:M20/M25/M40 family metallo-hydrolase [archaeon]|nr:M20/M25/M40 family metallo-hydrolase [archaeon]
MGFYEDLKLLAETPSEIYSENLIKPILLAQLEELTDTVECDKVNNLYGFRKGGKEGTIVLCAHHDKVMSSTIVGNIMLFSKKLNSNLVLRSEKYLEEILRFPSHISSEDGFEVAELLQDKKAKDFGERTRIPVPHEEDFEIIIPSGISVNTEIYKFKSYIPLYCLKELKISDWSVKGKLDDALGVALILDLLKNTDARDTPSILALFTNGEEKGLIGAEYCVENGLLKEFNPDKIIVLDVTRKQKLGRGIVLYENCGCEYVVDNRFDEIKGKKFDHTELYQEPVHMKSWIKEREKAKAKQSKSLIAELERLAMQKNYSLLTTGACSNDSAALAALTNIPTVALEVPMDDMHSRVEKCSISDIELMRRFLKEYLTK